MTGSTIGRTIPLAAVTNTDEITMLWQRYLALLQRMNELAVTSPLVYWAIMAGWLVVVALLVAHIVWTISRANRTQSDESTRLDRTARIVVVPVDRVSVVSAEGVLREMPIAGPARRILAYAVDWLCICALAALLLGLGIAVAAPPIGDFAAFVKSGGKPPGEGLERATLAAALVPYVLAPVLLFTLAEVLYFTFFECVTGGRSPGKRMLGLRVVCDDGSPLGPGASLIRNLVRLVDVLPGGYAVGLAAMMLSDRWQRLGDRAAGTLVVHGESNERVEDPGIGALLEPLQLTDEQLARVGPREVALARGTLSRLGDVDEPRARALLRDAAGALQKRIAFGPESQAEADDLLFLQRLLAAVQERERGNGR